MADGCPRCGRLFRSTRPQYVLYDGLNQGRINSDRLRSLLAGLPLPRFPDGRLDLAVSRRGSKTASQFIPGFIPGWPYSFIAVLEMDATSWTQILDAVRLGPDDDATAVTAEVSSSGSSCKASEHRANRASSS
jgi:hypothetical protein